MVALCCILQHKKIAIGKSLRSLKLLRLKTLIEARKQITVNNALILFAAFKYKYLKFMEEK